MKKRERSVWGPVLMALFLSLILWVSAWGSLKISDLIYTFLALYVMGTIGESLDVVGSKLAEIKEQNEEMREQIKRLVETADAIDGRVPRNTRSVLDEY
jgi:hypothetical protein